MPLRCPTLPRHPGVQAGRTRSLDPEARQKVNYHLKELEKHGLVELVEERRKDNVTERLVLATAASYVISPTALSAVQPDPKRTPDQLSARWLLAVAARLVRDVGSLITGAAKANKRVATFAIDGRVRFASAADRAAFAEGLTITSSRLASTPRGPSRCGGAGYTTCLSRPMTSDDMCVCDFRAVAMAWQRNVLHDRIRTRQLFITARVIETDHLLVHDLHRRSSHGRARPCVAASAGD